MLKQAWATGELIDQLAMMRQAFWYARLAGSTPPLATGTQPTASTSHQPDDLLPKQPAPKDCTVPATILQTDQANGASHNEQEDTGTSQLYLCSL